MNICITGALGHIGSYLIRHLDIPNVKRVHLVDNFLTQRYSSLFNLPDTYKYVFHEANILSESMSPIIKDSAIVIHLAAITDAESSTKNKKLVDTINKKGLKHIADLASLYKVKLIFPSTTSVYGSQSKLVDENCTDLQPQSPYAESKIWAERYLSKLGKKNSLQFTILRLGTIFGESIGMRFHTAVNKFIFQAVTNQEITVWKTAFHQKRPYCDIADAAAAINFTISNNVFHNEIYNVVTMNSTVKEIVSLIKHHIPDLRIRYVDSRIMNQLSYEVSNLKSISIGYSYSRNIERSIYNTIKLLSNVNADVVKKNI